jgi:hypothetical protein
MRISLGILATASVLFLFGAAGVLGTWALATATVIGLIGAICTVTVMEEREHSQQVMTALADSRRPALVD